MSVPTTAHETNGTLATTFDAIVEEVAAKARETLPTVSPEVFIEARDLVLAHCVHLHPDRTATVDVDPGSSLHATVAHNACDCSWFPTAPEGYCVHRLAVSILRRSEQLKVQRQAPPTPATDGWGETPPQTPAAPRPGRFTRATKTAMKLRLALTGPSGSGKSFSALQIASALGERIAVIDTEHGGSHYYAEQFTFDSLELTSFHPERYIEALHAAVQEGYQVVIVDSLSHAWMGTDGVLELVDKAAKRSKSGNSFSAWGDVTPLQRKLVETLLALPLHVIVTMRSKMEYVLETNSHGKQVPKKVGLAPIQRDAIEYEFDVVAEMDHEHTLIVTKSRLQSLADVVVPKPGQDFGVQVKAALEGRA